MYIKLNNLKYTLSTYLAACKDQLSDCEQRAERGFCSDLVYRADMQMKCMQTCLSYVRYDEDMMANCISRKLIITLNCLIFCII